MSEVIAIDQEKPVVIDKVSDMIEASGFTIARYDFDKPWGAYFALEMADAEKFAQYYFPDEKFSSFENLSPKFLVVAPHKRLSWQYHHRRAELWSVLQGPVGIKLSHNDNEPKDIRNLQEGQVYQFNSQTRHRLIGLWVWGVVAEIWKHDDPNNLSNEEDIVRVDDDFGRKSEIK